MCPGYGSSVFRYSELGVADAVLEEGAGRSTSQKHFRPRFAYSPPAYHPNGFGFICELGGLAVVGRTMGWGCSYGDLTRVCVRYFE